MRNPKRRLPAQPKVPSPVSWSEADDATLVRGVLDQTNPIESDAAWRAFFRRYGGIVEERIRRWTMEACRLLVSRDLADEVRLAFYMALLDNDKRCLRQYDPRQGDLASFLSRLGQRVAHSHFTQRLDGTDVFDLHDGELCTLDEAERQMIADGQEGARWLVRGR